MKIVNSFIPFKGFIAMNLLGIIFVRKEYAELFTATDERHELIHTRQMWEMGILPFYIWYVLEWLIRVLFTKYAFTKGAYRNISFEREAYKHQGNTEYLNTRKWYSWLRYLY